MKGMKPGNVPLERALSKLGIASRTVSRQWILDGKVKVNGVVRKDPLFPVFPERAKIAFEEKLVAKVAHRTFLLHKPRGVVTTRSDEKGRATVFSLIPEPGLHLIAVGRLDWATSGLLLLTNDTRLSDWLTDPESAVCRTYLVTVRQSDGGEIGGTPTGTAGLGRKAPAGSHYPAQSQRQGVPSDRPPYGRQEPRNPPDVLRALPRSHTAKKSGLRRAGAGSAGTGKIPRALPGRA